MYQGNFLINNVTGVDYAFGDKSCDCPNLGKNLRITGDPGNYCDVKIHKDDIDEFIKRYEAYKNKQKI
ncbi:MAG: hypothetical protein ABH971_02665 [bacterium]